MQRKILILKTPAGSDDLCNAIERRGFTPVFEPILTVVPTEEPIDEPAADAGLIFTSSNGVLAYAAKTLSRKNPVFTVGHETAAAARQAGFTDIFDAGGAAEDLARLVAKHKDNPALYVRAKHVSYDLAAHLTGQGVKVNEIIAYETIPSPNLSNIALDALRGGSILAVMFFSKRGAETFARLLKNEGLAETVRPIKALCIGEGMVQSVSVLPFGAVLTAGTPDRAGLLNLIDMLRLKQETL